MANPNQNKLPDIWQPLATHPVDLPLGVLKGAIEYAVQQPIALGIPRGDVEYFDQFATGAVMGSASILAYGAEGSQDIWELRLGDKRFQQLDPSAHYVNGYLESRRANTDVDERVYSRLLVVDGEIKPLEKFAQEALIHTLNVSTRNITSSGIDLGNVSHSQASRIIDLIRDQYAVGSWRQALQLALAAAHVGSFIRIAREASYCDKSGDVITVADDHINQELRAEYRTDIDLLVARSLKRGVRELRAAGRTHAADHTEAWLSKQEEGLSLDSFPPEVTMEDILTRPSYLNPRPDKGIPELGDAAYLAGGTGSRNYTIKYPNGDVYATDYPNHSEGARPILGNEEKGFSGNLNTGTVEGLVHTQEGWVEFEQNVRAHVARELVEEVLQKGVSFKQQTLVYSEVLRAAQTFIESNALPNSSAEIAAAKSQFAAVLMAAQCVKQTEDSVGKAAALYEFSRRGWGSIGEVESETGISLTHGQGLDKISEQAYEDFGAALFGYELARLAEKYTEHVELSEHIAQERSRCGRMESASFYYAQMMETAQRLMGKGKIAELMGQFVQADDGPRIFLDTDSK